ncbi:hypothetical protein ACP6L2_09300 [Sphingobacterium lactis]|uniref:hypothetical protein n=1 Tax=Sphingobacterium lactis TaxID=797291 RepID=UPI003F819F50
MWPVILINNLDAPVTLYIQTVETQNNSKLDLDFVPGIEFEDFYKRTASKLAIKEEGNRLIQVELPALSTTRLATGESSFPDVFEWVEFEYNGKKVRLNRDELQAKLKKEHFYNLLAPKKLLYLKGLF